MPGKMGPSDPTYIGPEEAEEMALMNGLLKNASQLLRRLNAKHSTSVAVGAIILDSEKYEFCDHRNNSVTGLAYDTCSEAVWHGLIRKNNLAYDASKAAFPDAFILQFDRGGMNGCGLFPNHDYEWKTCSKDFSHPGRPKFTSCDVWPPCNEKGLWQTATYTLDPAEKGDSLSLSLYDVAEPGNTRIRFDTCVDNAKAAKANGAQVVLSLARVHVLR
jgi:hypothetical protein